MIIRLATAADAGILANLNQDVQALHAKAWPTFFRKPTNRAEVEKRYQTVLQDSENRIYIGLEDETAVGYIYCEVARRPQDSINQARAFVYIHEISVKPLYRRRGFGRQLMQQVIELARFEGIDQVLLDTWSFNTQAKKFFANLGYNVFIEKMRLEVS